MKYQPKFNATVYLIRHLNGSLGVGAEPLLAGSVRSSEQASLPLIALGHSRTAQAHPCGAMIHAIHGVDISGAA
ncbi:hypothetical protein CWE08_11765 [Aliidiomarina iranensis]|uniref:Uncharacterized protein n=1 Tax=Aliidiomarina iranensis TaxID=1434071 RepID=A0A432VPT8_9GAMM|nr:hypothetical protein CWE08_11765 [Aliidiomarina iranensis]